LQPASQPLNLSVLEELPDSTFQKKPSGAQTACSTKPEQAKAYLPALVEPENVLQRSSAAQADSPEKNPAGLMATCQKNRSLPEDCYRKTLPGALQKRPTPPETAKMPMHLL